MPVRHFVLSNNGNEQQAEDLYHDAFIAAWRNVQLGRFEKRDTNSFANYVLAIAKNKWIDQIRSMQRKKTTSLHDDSTYYGADNEKTEDEDDREIENVKQQFEKIGKNCKNVLTDFYYKKLSMRAIAIVNGWTEQTARNNKYRCLQKLRELINQNKP